MKVVDRRTDEQRKTHYWLVVGTDPGMSGWGQCENGSSYAAWACTDQGINDCECMVERRGDMENIRTVLDRSQFPYKPNSSRCGHLSIYVYDHRNDDQCTAEL